MRPSRSAFGGTRGDDGASLNLSITRYVNHQNHFITLLSTEYGQVKCSRQADIAIATAFTVSLQIKAQHSSQIPRPPALSKSNGSSSRKEIQPSEATQALVPPILPSFPRICTKKMLKFSVKRRCAHFWMPACLPARPPVSRILRSMLKDFSHHNPSPS